MACTKRESKNHVLLSHENLSLRILLIMELRCRNCFFLGGVFAWQTSHEGCVVCLKEYFRPQMGSRIQGKKNKLVSQQQVSEGSRPLPSTQGWNTLQILAWGPDAGIGQWVSPGGTLYGACLIQPFLHFISSFPTDMGGRKDITNTRIPHQWHSSGTRMVRFLRTKKRYFVAHWLSGDLDLPY